MVLRPSRSRSGEDDPYVHWKVRLFGAGALLALTGMGTGLGWLVWAGMALLGVGLGLRFLPRPKEQPKQE